MYAGASLRPCARYSKIFPSKILPSKILSSKILSSKILSSKILPSKIPPAPSSIMSFELQTNKSLYQYGCTDDLTNYQEFLSPLTSIHEDEHINSAIEYSAPAYTGPNHVHNTEECDEFATPVANSLFNTIEPESSLHNNLYFPGVSTVIETTMEHENVGRLHQRPEERQQVSLIFVHVFIILYSFPLSYEYHRTEFSYSLMSIHYAGK